MPLSGILAKPAVQIAGAIVLPSIGGFVLNSVIGRSPNNDKWFEGLKFPSFRPPNWVFPPVWTTLYSSMGYASYVIYKQGGGFNGPARIPLILYGSQLALNWAFIPVFTGAKNLKLSTIHMVGITAAATTTAVSFYGMSKQAGLLLIPYLAWLVLATSLTYCLYRDNPKEAIESTPETTEAKKTV